MRQSSLWIVLWAVVIAASGMLPQVSCGQEATPAKPTTTNHRLPPYYKEVVTEMQRQEIYKIQDKYSGKLSALADEIKKIQAARNAEIEAVLTAEQKTMVDVAKAEAAKKKAAAAVAAGATTTVKSATPAPATTPAPAAAPAVAAPTVPATAPAPVPVKPASK